MSKFDVPDQLKDIDVGEVFSNGISHSESPNLT